MTFYDLHVFRMVVNPGRHGIPMDHVWKAMICKLTWRRLRLKSIQYAFTPFRRIDKKQKNQPKTSDIGIYNFGNSVLFSDLLYT